ncbi:transglycosylase SLT domain-containing protein [Methylomonas montana]|uniref:transglycosylase SLT domain-containing protein n=1 Tax=Methylomonas montana TaxID=3058963 RepID=UPI0026585608|nr:transglycosylase SLT domain-containing protein [Methylomonas montana]WKJ88748.1 transglycosylase SLT domain-containing protein [Methylomonas montana]
MIADSFLQAADEFNLPPALLIGIASRESRVGWLLDDTGWGDLGRAFGIMQIDHRSHTVLGRPDPRSQQHINQAAEIIHDNLAKIRRNHTSWPEARQLQGAVAAYNFGANNVCTLDGIDKGSTHDDYSNDVWARALYFAGL